MTAIAIQRVSVRCMKCNTIASLWVQNLAAWRRDHSNRCFPRPMSIAESEAKRAGADANETSVSGGGAAKAAPLHPVHDPEQCTCGTPYGRCCKSGRMIAYGGWQQVRCEEHTPEGATIVAAPRCGLLYGVDRCVLPLGHTEECEDADGNQLEIAF